MGGTTEGDVPLTWIRLSSGNMAAPSFKGSESIIVFVNNWGLLLQWRHWLVLESGTEAESADRIPTQVISSPQRPSLYRPVGYIRKSRIAPASIKHFELATQCLRGAVLGPSMHQ
jgi:hypothetical protein